MSENDELDELQEKLDDNDEFFDCVDMVYHTKDKHLKKNDKVLVTGGTKYGSTQLCTVIEVTAKMAEVMDGDARRFRKNKKFFQKVTLLSKNTREHWLVD